MLVFDDNSELKSQLDIRQDITGGASASTTATTNVTTAQIKNLIGRVKKNNRAARAARSYEQVRAVLCKHVKLPHLPF